VTAENAFSVLGLAPRFGIEDAELDRCQRQLYVTRSQEGALALEQLNEAYRIVHDPIARAELLFDLLGWAKQAPPDPALLAWVFAEREQVEEACARGDEDFLWDWLTTARKRRDALLSALAGVLDGPDESASAENPADRALALLEELRYLSRALGSAQQAAEALEDVAP
jgi:hypothetical protein